MALCYKCQQPIAFKKLPSGKMCPTNPDGSDHWDTCNSKRAYTGPKMVFMGRTVDGVLIENKDHKPMMSLAAIRMRKKYGIS
jgi:hypothetical protein